MKTKKIIITLFFILICISFLSARESKKVLFDGFDEIGIWGPATWEHNVGEVKLSKKFVSQGRFSLMAQFDKTSQFYKAIVAAEQPYDLSKIDILYVDIYCESDGINTFSFAATTGDLWEWHESKNYRLMPGWNRNIKIKVSAKLWKTKRTEWVNRASLRNSKDVRRICFGFWGSGGKVYIDNLRAVGKIQGKKTRFLGPYSLRLWESFEKKQKKWEKAGWKTKAVSSYLLQEYASEGKYSFRCDFEGITTSLNASFSRNYSADWTKIKRIYFDIYNDTGKWLKISLAITTGEGWTWHETPLKFLAPGWNKNLFFDLNTPKFKTEDSEWKHIAYLKTKNDVRRIAICILGTSPEYETTGSIFIDNIRFEGSEQ